MPSSHGNNSAFGAKEVNLIPSWLLIIWCANRHLKSLANAVCVHLTKDLTFSDFGEAQKKIMKGGT